MKGYNTLGVTRGDITEGMLAALTAAFQRQENLPVDGFCGPRTRVALMEYCSKRERDVGSFTDRDAYIRRVLSIANGEIGNGEDPKMGNNLGKDIEVYRKGDGTGRPLRVPHSWCASFVSYCFLRAAKELKRDAPFKGSRGAKDLVRQASRSGREIPDPEPGAIIAWHRGGVSWQGHVGIVEVYDPTSDLLITIEGNKNVRGQQFARVERFSEPRGRWRKRLYKIARVG